MWPFRTSKPDESLVNRLQALEARVGELERERTAMAVEWDDWFVKFRGLYAKLRKAAKSEEETAEEGPTMPQDRRSPGRQGEAPMSPAAARLLAGGAANGVLSR